MLLSEAVTQWTCQRRLEGYSPSTLVAYRMQMGLLTRHVGDLPIDQVTLPHLRDYIGMRTGRVKAATVAHGVRMIRSFFRWCHEEELMLKNVSLKLKEPKLPRRIPKFLTVDELELLRDSCKTPREHALLEFLFASGGRAAEVGSIKLADVDWNRRAIIVMGKGSKEREVYFNAKTALWLKRYLATRCDTCEYLFTNGKGFKHRLSPHQIWWAIKRVANRCDLRARVWPHKMRHTMATILLNNGADLTAVQSILGHERPETTQLYAHLSGQRRQDQYNRYMPQ